jgi:2-haloacid dehalogenase
MSRIRNVVFDCNESILDLTTITPVFERLFGSLKTMRLWFQIAVSGGVKITSADREELTDRFATMPPHPEVPVALRRLKEAGFHLFTLTDNTAAISGRQLTHGGIVDFFDRRFSVDDTAKRHKPAPEAYAEVTQGLGASPSEMRLVACHTRDTIGAQAVGWEAGLIQRANNDVLDSAAQPQYLGKDLKVVAGQIIERNGSAPG